MRVFRLPFMSPGYQSELGTNKGPAGPFMPGSSTQDIKKSVRAPTQICPQITL